MRTNYSLWNLHGTKNGTRRIQVEKNQFSIFCCVINPKMDLLNNFWISSIYETQLTIISKCVYSDISYNEKRHQPLDIQKVFQKNEIMLLLYHHNIVCVIHNLENTLTGVVKYKFINCENQNHKQKLQFRFILRGLINCIPV